MNVAGYLILLVGVLFSSWIVNCVLFMVGIISQKVSINYLRFSLFGTIGLSFLIRTFL